MATPARSVVLIILALLAEACTGPPATIQPASPAPSTQYPTPSPSPPPRILPSDTPKSTATSVFAPARLPTPTQVLDECSRTQFPVGVAPLASPPPVIELLEARNFVGLRVPPFPDGIELEHQARLPYGEGFWSGPFYSLFLTNKGGAQMLWIGLDYVSGGTMITDAIPFPPLLEHEVLVPFFCARNMESDLYLVAVARCGPHPLTEIIHAWRINPASERLETVSTRGIQCFAW